MVLGFNSIPIRAAGRSKNPGGINDVVGIICPLVEIRLTDLPKSGGTMAPTAPTGLPIIQAILIFRHLIVVK